MNSAVGNRQDATVTVSVVDMALYLPYLATETLTLQVPVVEGAVSTPVETLHFPEVTLYVRTPFETDLIIVDNFVDDFGFTALLTTVKPAVEEILRLLDDVAPLADFVEMANE